MAVAESSSSSSRRRQSLQFFDEKSCSLSFTCSLASFPFYFRVKELSLQVEVREEGTKQRVIILCFGSKMIFSTLDARLRL